MNDKNQNIKQKMSINQYGKRPCKVWLFQRKVEPFFLYQNLQLITLKHQQKQEERKHYQKPTNQVLQTVE